CVITVSLELAPPSNKENTATIEMTALFFFKTCKFVGLLINSQTRNNVSPLKTLLYIMEAWMRMMFQFCKGSNDQIGGRYQGHRGEKESIHIDQLRRNRGIAT